MGPSAFSSGRERSVAAGQVLLRGASERQAGKHIDQAAIMRSREGRMNTLYQALISRTLFNPYNNSIVDAVIASNIFKGKPAQRGHIAYLQSHSCS